MIFSYTIDKNIIDINDEHELETWLAKANHLFGVIKKRTVWYDCDQAGMSNPLIKSYTDVRELIDDDVLKTKLESFWMKFIWQQCFFQSSSCNCDHSNQCKIESNIDSLNNVLNKKLGFYITYKNSSQEENIEKVDIDDFYNSEIFKQCKKTEYSEENPIDNETGKLRIEENFYSLINICQNEIVIIDRNVFERWNENYKNGLIQFIDTIYKHNPVITLTIITRYQDHHRDDKNTSAQDILRYINLAIKNSPIKIKIKLCDKANGKFDHERYILFDEVIGAKLNRGLDTFVHNSQGDGVVITYCTVDEVIEKRKNALFTLIKDGDFKQFSNQ